METTTKVDAGSFGGPEFRVEPDPEAMSRAAAALIVAEVRQRPHALLCAAAGASPAGTYALLAEAARQDPDLFRHLRVIKVDEWGGLALNDPASCELDLQDRLLGPLGISPDRYQGFDGQAADPAKECERIRAWLAANGPVDICVLGVGVNGHVAMNEPAEECLPGPHVARLAPSSLQHPMLARSGTVPTYGLSLGMGDLLQSRRILLLAAGERKRAVFERLRRPVVTPTFPVSFLWLHPRVTAFWARSD